MTVVRTTGRPASVPRVNAAGRPFTSTFWTRAPGASQKPAMVLLSLRLAGVLASAPSTPTTYSGSDAVARTPLVSVSATSVDRVAPTWHAVPE